MSPRSPPAAQFHPNIISNRGHSVITVSDGVCERFDGTSIHNRGFQEGRQVKEGVCLQDHPHTHSNSKTCGANTDVPQLGDKGRTEETLLQMVTSKGTDLDSSAGSASRPQDTAQAHRHVDESEKCETHFSQVNRFYLLLDSNRAFAVLRSLTLHPLAAKTYACPSRCYCVSRALPSMRWWVQHG